MTSQTPQHHFIVYQRSDPWKTGPMIIRDYRQYFNCQLPSKDIADDLRLLHCLRGDSYESVIVLWDGRGLLGDSVVSDFGGLGVVFVSKAILDL